MSITNSGTLDLADNDMRLTAARRRRPSPRCSSWRRGTGEHVWERAGLTSSAARNANGGDAGLGVLSGAEYNPFGGTGTFAGVSYAATDTLVKYTWNGDANFSGTVNFDDYVPHRRRLQHRT